MKNVGLVGEMGAGKDLVAELMPDYLRKAFGDEIRLVARNLRVNGVTAAYCQLCKMFNQRTPRELTNKLAEFAAIPQTNSKDRKLLQEIGTYCRLEKDLIWVNAVLEALSKDGKYVVTDCRRQSEFDALKAKGFVMIYIDADLEVRKQRLLDRDGGYDEAAFNHPAEQEIRSIRDKCDWILMNNGTIEQLQGAVEMVLEDENA